MNSLGRPLRAPQLAGTLIAPLISREFVFVKRFSTAVSVGRSLGAFRRIGGGAARRGHAHSGPRLPGDEEPVTAGQRSRAPGRPTRTHEHPMDHMLERFTQAR